MISKIALQLLIPSLFLAVGCTSSNDNVGAQSPAQQNSQNKAQGQNPQTMGGMHGHMHGGMKGGMHGQNDAAMCQQMSQMADVQSENTPDGVAFLLKPKDGNLAALKTRVDQMVAMHNSPAHKDMMKAHGMVDSTASAQQGSDNIRLAFAAVNPSDVSRLQTQMKDHMAMMQKGQCPMMQK